MSRDDATHTSLNDIWWAWTMYATRCRRGRALYHPSYDGAPPSPSIYIAAAQWSGRCFVHCCANWVYSTVFNRYEIGRYNGVTCTQFEGGYVRLWAASLPSMHRRWILSWLCSYKNKWDSHKWTPNSENLNSYVEMRFYEAKDTFWPNDFMQAVARPWELFWSNIQYLFSWFVRSVSFDQWHLRWITIIIFKYPNTVRIHL